MSAADSPIRLVRQAIAQRLGYAAPEAIVRTSVDPDGIWQVTLNSGGNLLAVRDHLRNARWEVLLHPTQPLTLTIAPIGQPPNSSPVGPGAWKGVVREVLERCSIPPERSEFVADNVLRALRDAGLIEWAEPASTPAPATSQDEVSQP